MRLPLPGPLRWLLTRARPAPATVLARAEPVCGSCRQLQQVLDAVDVAIVSCDSQGRLVLANSAAAALLDLPPGRLDPEQPWPTSALKLRPALEQALVESDATIELEVEAQGRTLALEGRASAIRSASGELEGAALALRDVTRLRSLVSQRLESWEALAHDLKVPLNSISGFTTLLLQEAVGPLNPLQRDFLRTIEQEGQRLLQAVQGFLEEARTGSPAAQLNRTEVRLRPLVEEAIERVRSLAVRKSLTITVDIPDELPTVAVDPNKISLVLVNLLDNAISFSREGKQIVIAVREAGDSLEVSVRDEGVGIPPAALELVFGRFYRASNQPAGGRPGVGLGLAICKQVVESHGGRIWAESDGPETGARFVFTLPIAYHQARLETLGTVW